MEKNNNEKIFNNACELTDLAAQIELMRLYLDGVAVNDKKGIEFSTQYFMTFGLPTIDDNLTKIKKDIERLSNGLVDVYENEGEDQ